MTGTFDSSFGRNERLARMLALGGHQVEVVREEVWGRDRLGRAIGGRTRTLVRLLIAYPRLVVRLFRAPRPDVYLVGHPGWFDLPAVALVGSIRRVPVVFDCFIGLYDTLISDRQLASPGSLVGRLARLADRVACRLATVTMADTPLNADFLSRQTGVRRDRFRVLWVGARDDIFVPRREADPEPDSVLFYGTMIPLHGPMTILEAAGRLASDGIRVVMVGEGQLRSRVERALADLGLSNVELLESVPIERLPDMIASATVVLGVFGDSMKAQRIVPHKVFEAVAAGRPVVTGDTPAVRMAFRDTDLVLVPVGDPDALATAIRGLMPDPDRRRQLRADARGTYMARFHERNLALLLTRHLRAAVSRKQR